MRVVCYRKLAQIHSKAYDLVAGVSGTRHDHEVLGLIPGLCVIFLNKKLFFSLFQFTHLQKTVPMTLITKEYRPLPFTRIASAVWREEADMHERLVVLYKQPCPDFCQGE